MLKSSDEELFCLANEKRKKYKGDDIHLRALIEFTNVCKCSCLYCGLRCENKLVNRYRLDDEKILNSVKKAVDFGIKTVVLQGGEDIYFTQKKLLYKRFLDKFF